MMQTLPTTTPIIGLISRKAEEIQRADLRLRALQALYDQHLITPLPTSTELLAPPPNHEPTPQVAGVGVIVDETCWGGDGDTLIRSENYWQGQWENEFIMVCAGTLSFDPPRGGILLKVYDLQARQYVVTPTTYLLSSPPTKQLRVVDAVGARLTLRDPSGALFYFDVPTRQWVNP
jgi:hypothetical protein